MLALRVLMCYLNVVRQIRRVIPHDPPRRQYALFRHRYRSSQTVLSAPLCMLALKHAFLLSCSLGSLRCLMRERDHWRARNATVVDVRMRVAVPFLPKHAVRCSSATKYRILTKVLPPPAVSISTRLLRARRRCPSRKRSSGN